MKLANCLGYGLTLACLMPACLMLVGCVETRFESPLGDNIETCDARWKGLWNGMDDELAKKGEAITAFHVNDDCEFTVLDQPEARGVLKRVHVPINYVHAGGNDYIVVADVSIKSLAKLAPPYAITPAPEKAYFFARYRVHGDRIDVYQADSARVAKLIVDGKVDGTVNKTQNELHAFVRGSRAQMLDLVRNESLFEAKPSLQLVRSKQTLGEFEDSVQHAAAGKKP
jgi:hypothetical protein